MMKCQKAKRKQRVVAVVNNRPMPDVNNSARPYATFAQGDSNRQAVRALRNYPSTEILTAGDGSRDSESGEVRNQRNITPYFTADIRGSSLSVPMRRPHTVFFQLPRRYFSFSLIPLPNLQSPYLH
jgi:hypothetical protein